MPNPNKKRLIQNIALIALVAILGLYVLKDDGNHDQAKLAKTLYDKSIGDEATEIKIHAAGNKDILLNKVGDVWRVVKPSEFEADKEQVRHLFTLLSENAETNYDIKDKNLVDYGLDEDRLSISFNKVKIIFGKFNNVSQKRYVLKGDRMYLVSETVTGLLQAGEDAFKIKSPKKPVDN